MISQDTQELITIHELGDRLRVHPDTLRSLYRRKVFPGIKLGHRTLRFDFREVVQALRTANDPAAPAE